MHIHESGGAVPSERNLREFPRREQTLCSREIERSLGAQTTRAQTFQVLRHQVLRSIDDAQIFAPRTLHGRLSVSVASCSPVGLASMGRCGFEFNFPENKTRNAWRVCYWREPMSNYEGATLSDLRGLFETRSRILFATEFYRLAARRAN